MNHFFKLTISLFIVICVTYPLTAKENIISLHAEGSRLIIEKSVNAAPDSEGFVSRQTLKLPPFIQGCYYRPMTGGSHFGPNGNRVMPLAFSSLQDLVDYSNLGTQENNWKNNHNLNLGQYLLLELTAGRKYMAIMPLCTTETVSELSFIDGAFQLRTGHHGTAHVEGDLPILATATGRTPYEASHNVWSKVINNGIVNTKWRYLKNYPEMYNYIGWCSWEFYRTDIDSDKIKDAIASLESNPFPFRWVMVDDGYLNHENKRALNFSPNTDKFPKGWQDITRAKNPNGIRWFGLWRHMLGYMSAISKANTFNLPSGTLVEGACKKYMLPNGTESASKLFYNELAKSTRNGGFDFVKVDFQAASLYMYYGMPNPVRCAYNNSLAMEEACQEHLNGLLNCIAQMNNNVCNTKYSALTRSSRDYSHWGPNKQITYQSFANHLWHGKVVWGDLDMFHSAGKNAKALALARAISGGPVYISDEPSQLDASILNPFCDSDGRIFRADAPAVLLPESYFIDPLNGDEAFRVIAPVGDKVAAIALFNFTNNKSVNTWISRDDYGHAGEQLQPYSGSWTVSPEGLIGYEQESKNVINLAQNYSFEMKPNSAQLFLLYPKVSDWAVIGRTDKYLPAATVKINSVTEKKISIALVEQGPFAIWSGKGAPRAKKISFKDAGNGLYLADIPIKAEEITITIER